MIEYGLPKDSPVKLTIFNILGEKVRTFKEKKQTPGYKKLFGDGKNKKGELVSSGIYFYKIETEGFTQTKKMVFLK